MTDLRYSSRILKLSKARSVERFRAAAERVLASASGEPHSHEALLRVCCKSAYRLGLHREAFDWAKTYCDRYGESNGEVLRVLGLSCLSSHSMNELGSVESILSGFLGRTDIGSVLEDVDADEFIKTFPGVVTRIVKLGKRGRKHKIRFPVGFNPASPGAPADPERWLPKSQRTSKKKTKKILGPQGTGGAIGSLGVSGPSTAQVETAKSDKKKRK